jgi:hypothetical protein
MLNSGPVYDGVEISIVKIQRINTSHADVFKLERMRLETLLCNPYSRFCMIDAKDIETKCPPSKRQIVSDPASYFKKPFSPRLRPKVPREKAEHFRIGSDGDILSVAIQGIPNFRT